MGCSRILATCRELGFVAVQFMLTGRVISAACSFAQDNQELELVDSALTSTNLLQGQRRLLTGLCQMLS